MANVTLSSVSKSFEETLAVQDFSVSVRDGELVTFLGPSGCGKTTTLRLVAGFIRPTKGRVIIGDRVVADAEAGLYVPPEDRAVGMVFQSYAVWPHMTVLDNVAYPLKIQKQEKALIRERSLGTLELVRMPELADRFPHQLSGGQQQRVALARALVMDPEVLLLDEPLSNLDAKLREEMRLELKELQEQTGVTIIFVTHDQLEAMVLSDRVVVMNAGFIQQVGTPREIYRNPANRFVADFIGVANFLECRVDSDRTLRLMSDAGIQLPVVVPRDRTTDARLTVMVRPEEIRLQLDAAGRARITKKIFVGEAVDYLLGLGDTILRVRAASDLDYPVNAAVSLQFDKYLFLD